MTTTLTIDKAGRIVLPKPVRDELQLSPGDSLEVDSSEERVILRPTSPSGAHVPRNGSSPDGQDRTRAWGAA